MRYLIIPLLLGAICIAPAAETNPKAVGSANAPLKLEVFSDFQCPACRQLQLETIQKAIGDCVATGKVQIIHRDFPLPQHQYAREAARYANAAARLRQYEKVCDELFKTQADWAASGKIDATVAKVLSASDMAKVRQYVKDAKMEDEINSDQALGMKIPIRQTPTMVLTYKQQVYPISGAVSYPILKRFIDDLLTK